jgi:hypothetical protein
MKAEERRRWHEQAIAEGGSVMHGGRVITRKEALPSVGELASTPEERLSALADLDARRRALDLEEERLRGGASDQQSGAIAEGAGVRSQSQPGAGGVKSKPQALPEDFPGKSVLEDNGYKTLDQVRSLSREELVALNGIGEKRADAILEALGK